MSELSRSEASRYDLGLLFTDGMPDHDDATGYRGAVAARAAGISYRQLDYWARSGSTASATSWYSSSSSAFSTPASRCSRSASP
jgi:hypothetical protein